MNTTETATIPAEIAKELAKQSRKDLEFAAKKHTDCLAKADQLIKSGDNEETAECAAVFYAQAERMVAKANRHDAEFKRLERICIALTDAGV
jgi:hypothetical protein